MKQKKTHEKILSAIAKVANVDKHLVQFKDLGGLTNTNYRVRVHSTSYFVRVGTKYPEVFGTSTENDWHCTSLATSLGLSPKSFLHFPEDRIIISEFIDTQGREIHLHDDTVTSHHVLGLLRKLHESGIRFPNTFCPYATIRKYAYQAVKRGVTLPPVIERLILPTIERLRETRDTPSIHYVPCHLDLHRENVLDDGQRLWFIDWEYAAMADPYFDLACIASTDTFTDDEMEQFLATYLQREPTLDELKHLYFMRILADVRWSLFCYIHTQLTPGLEGTYRAFAEDFLYQSLDRLEKLPNK